MTVVNGSGQTVFDTDEGLFVVTNRITESHVVTAKTARQGGNPKVNTPLDHEVNTLLSSCNAAANTVRGTIAVTTASGQGGVSNLGRFNAGGSYMHYQGGMTRIDGRDNFILNAMAVYTFYASAGGLYINERVILQAEFNAGDAMQSITLLETTLAYDLFVGTYV